MGYFTEIETFNTHNLKESSVLSLNTGREKLIESIQRVIDSNLASSTSIQHLALIGPRGIGKSFLLRYFQIKSKDTQEVEYVLFPEEQYNINKPSEFIYEILHHISGHKIQNKPSFNTNETEEEWSQALILLTKQIQIKKKEFKNYLLIIAIENLDVLLENVFDKKINASRLRSLLNETSDFMILGATLKHDIDSDYTKRLFKAFQKYEIPIWKNVDFIEYFYKRLEIFKKENPNKIKPQDISKSKNKLKAISQFSGGSPRIAIILANLIFNKNLLNTTQTLDKVLENLTAYYMAIFEKIPEKSRILLDTLIRNGENISQTKLAEMVNAKQSDISRAFKLLQDKNIVCKSKIKSNKETLYFVSDRMMALLYNKRYINKDISETRLSVYSDFLISFYDEKEIQEQALDCFELNQEAEGKMILALLLKKNNIHIDSMKSLSKEQAMDITENYHAINQQLKLKRKMPQEIIDFENKHSLTLDNNNDKAVNELLSDINLINSQFINNKYLNNIIAVKYEDIAKFYRNKQEFSESIIYHDKALLLMQKLENKIGQYNNLIYIGINYLYLEEFSKSIVYYKKTILIIQKLKIKKVELMCLYAIAMSYTYLKEFNQSIAYYGKAMKLSKELGDKKNEACSLGNIIGNYLYFNQEKAWDIFSNKNDNIQTHLIVKEMADIITLTEKWHGRNKGFHMARNILDNLSYRLDTDEVYESIKYILISLLKGDVSYDLLLDISSLIEGKYTQKEELMSNAVIKCMEYKHAENKEKFMQELNPDLSILIKSFIEEFNIFA